MRFAVLVAVAGCAGEGAAPDAPTDAGISDYVRYPADTIRSPLTTPVVDAMRAIVAHGQGKPDVFAKVGASGTVSTNLLNCFAGVLQPQYRLELAGRDWLMPAIDYFRAGRIAETSPFERATLAAEVGKTARWAISGSPSPLEQELAAGQPRFAFVNYGTNEMGQGTPSTFPAALDLYWEAMNELLDQLGTAGVATIITGLNPRGDNLAAAHWVPIFDAATRGLAEARRLPYISLAVASAPLVDQGLVADGIHGNVYVDGSAQPCVFDTTGLGYGYNVRNLASMETLAAVKASVVDGQPAPDTSPLPPIAGAGTDASPFALDRTSFTHTFDTRHGERVRASYSACDQGQDESGPEIVYRMQLDAPAALRIAVLDIGDVDVDVHVLVDGACVERADRLIDRTFPAGELRIVVDSFVSWRGEHAGMYTLVVQACESGDPDC